MKLAEVIGRVARKPPSYLAGRAWREARKRARSPWLRHKLRTLTPSTVARAAGRESLSSYWRELTRAGFLVNKGDRETIGALYQTHYALEHEQLSRRVERILHHEFDILGSGPTLLGPEMEWHTDFKSGRRWESEPSEHIDYAELHLPSDVKVPWELSRCHHFVTLGQAWVVDKNEAAVREFGAQVQSWISSNPTGYGVNWACTMEVGLRATNWIWAMALFADAPLSDEFWDTMLLALYHHGLWIPEHLEIAHVNGNHYVADALGLVACGLLFRGFSEGIRWLDWGARILEDEIQLQVDEDGVDIEASIPYHRLVLEIYLVAALFMKAAGQAPSTAYWAKLEAMIEYVHAYTMDNGMSPVIGDADNARVLIFGDGAVRDHRYILSTGCVLCGRPDWKYRSGKFWEDSLWLLGPSHLALYTDVEEHGTCRSRAFPVSGFYIFRSLRQYVFVDVGPVGFRGLGGHGHNDCLSFEWHAFGHPILTDSGLYVYTASPQWRDRFRSTEYHSTIRVDGEEINHFLSPPTLWFLGNDARPIDVHCHMQGLKDFLHAGHIGYRRLSDPVTVYRTFEVDHEAIRLKLTDRIEGEDSHSVEIFFHVAAGANCRVLSEAVVECLWPGKARLRMQQLDGPAMRFDLREGWFAPSYGVKTERVVCVASVHSRLPIEVVWELSAENLA